MAETWSPAALSTAVVEAAAADHKPPIRPMSAPDGALSGIGNLGPDTSGLLNAGGQGNSGFQNCGNLQSGRANLGNSISGLYNASNLNLFAQAAISRIGNFGAQLSGVLQSSAP